MPHHCGLPGNKHSAISSSPKEPQPEDWKEGWMNLPHDLHCENAVNDATAISFISSLLQKARDEKDHEWLLTMNEACRKDFAAGREEENVRRTAIWNRVVPEAQAEWFSKGQEAMRAEAMKLAEDMKLMSHYFYGKRTAVQTLADFQDKLALKKALAPQKE